MNQVEISCDSFSGFFELPLEIRACKITNCIIIENKNTSISTATQRLSYVDYARVKAVK